MSTESTGIAQVRTNPEDPTQHSVLWLLAEHPNGAGSVTVTASMSGDSIAATNVHVGRDGFVESTFALPETGCWSFRATWGDNETTIEAALPA